MKIVHLRSARVMFGFGPSPYILGAALDKHFEKYEKDYNHTTKELLENVYIKIKKLSRRVTPKILTPKILYCPKILVHGLILSSPKIRK